MTTGTGTSLRERLDRTVRALCPVVSAQLAARGESARSEFDLRRELVGCILSSHVRYTSAVAGTTNLLADGMLADDWWQGRARREFRLRVLAVLSGRRRGLPHPGSYRFPHARSDQLAAVRDALAIHTLSERLADAGDAKLLRKSLISDLPGLGPKQASLFLRNAGATYDLAILDSHVLRFIAIQRLVNGAVNSVGTVAAYERAEEVIVRYAAGIGYPPGLVDVAIWATMKAAHEVFQ